MDGVFYIISRMDRYVKKYKKELADYESERLAPVVREINNKMKERVLLKE